MILTLVTVRGMIFSSRWIHAIIHHAFGYQLDNLLHPRLFPLRILRPFVVTLAFHLSTSSHASCRRLPRFQLSPVQHQLPRSQNDLGTTRNDKFPQRMVQYE